MRNLQLLKILPVISFSCVNPNKGALYFILALIKKKLSA